MHLPVVQVHRLVGQPLAAQQRVLRHQGERVRRGPQQGGVHQVLAAVRVHTGLQRLLLRSTVQLPAS
jgi:hypothetical protein